MAVLALADLVRPTEDNGGEGGGILDPVDGVEVFLAAALSGERKLFDAELGGEGVGLKSGFFSGGRLTSRPLPMLMFTPPFG